MSGIFGIIRSSGAVSERDLAVMAEVLKHRGPDGIRYSVSGRVGLGHCMLQSTPESLHESLPYQDQMSGLAITADCRIDNREQLIADIPLRFPEGEVVSDSQLILRAYQKWGESCVDHLLGDFAFVIMDDNIQALFVARDHMGCKPFYYHRTNDQFAFASSADAVAHVATVRPTLNVGRVADCLVDELEGIDKVCTFYNEISRMPPAHCGYYRDGALEIRQYWCLKPSPASHVCSDQEYLEAFKEVYTEAVRVRLRGITPPASMLSGGLDSSTIVALARDWLFANDKPPLQTYSAISGSGAQCAETRSVKAIIAQGKLDSVCVEVSDVDDQAVALTEAMQALEDPFDGGWTLLSMMYLKVAQGGGKFVLDGLEGHLAVGAPPGYIRHLMRGGEWRSAWKEAKGLSYHLYRGSHSPMALYLRSALSLLTPRKLTELKRRFLAGGRYRGLVSGSFISPSFARQVDLKARMLKYEKTLATDQGTPGEQSVSKLQAPFLTSAIERYERLASYAGIETRHPLLDIRLLEFAVNLPLRQKVEGGWSKFMLRRLAEGLLPDSVVWRDDWERLGWKYAERFMRVLDRESGCPVDAMIESLAPYIDLSLLEKYQRDGELGEDMERLESLSQQYTVYQWLTGGYQAAMRVSGAAAELESLKVPGVDSSKTG